MTPSEIVKQWAIVTCNWLPTDKQVTHLLASLEATSVAQDATLHVACQSGAVIREEGE